MENIIYACLCINPNFHFINHTLFINFLKTIHEYSSLKIPICRSFRLHIIIWPDKLQEQPQQFALLWLFAAL